MIEVLNSLFMVLVHFIHLLGRLFAHLYGFLQYLFDILIQIWIATFSISASGNQGLLEGWEGVGIKI